jgi:aspartyl-tRNA(Asn)/glutamyl-tRNA(Gln) amidotransferase subunit A
VVAYANSLDTVGILAKTIKDIREVFGVINGPDPQDPTNLSPASRSRILTLLKGRPKRNFLRIGVPIEYNVKELTDPVLDNWRRVLQALQELGHELHVISLPATKQALSAYYVLAPAEASSNLAKYDGVRYGSRSSVSDGVGGALYSSTRGEGFGDEVKRRILLGAYSLSAEAIKNYFIQAQKVRRLVQRDFDSVFALPNPLHPEIQFDLATFDECTNLAQVDVLVCPTAPTLPPTIESVSKQTSLDACIGDVFTVPASLAGLPAINVPTKLQELDEVNSGQPCIPGIQVIGQYGDDELVLQVAEIIQSLR